MAKPSAVSKKKPKAAVPKLSKAHRAALTYLDAGFSVLPVKENKAPALPTGFTNLTQKPTATDLETWYGNHDYGVGIACGKVSGHLQVLDIEYGDYWTDCADLLEADQPGLLSRLPRIQTPGKDADNPGVHLYFRSKVKPPGQKLARLTPDEAEQRTGDKGKTTAIECKSSGYVVAPGSPGSCHPSGRLYSHVDGPEIIETPVISNEEAEAVYRCARALDRASPEEAAEQQATATPFAGKVGCSAGNRAGDRFNQLASWEDVFAGTGWKRWRCRGETQYWTRPGKEAGASGSTGFCHNSSGDLLFIFSSNAAPFEDGKAYNKFRAFALVQHAGDFKAAARAAGTQFPDPSQPTASEQPGDDQHLEQKERDGEILADLLAQLEIDPQQALSMALDNADCLARLERNDPATWAQLLIEFSNHGLKAGDKRALEKAVNSLKKKTLEAEKLDRQQRAVDARLQSQAQRQGLEFRNYVEIPVEGENGKVGVAKQGLPIERSYDQMQAIAPGWPKRIGNRLFIETIERNGPAPLFRDKPAELFAWIAKRLQHDQSERNPIDWQHGSSFNSEERFFAYLQQIGENYTAVEAFPHHPPMEDHYYIHPPVSGGDGVALRKLLDSFCCDMIDRDLILAFFLTVLWGGKPASRPAFLFTTDDPSGRGVGKTTVAEMASLLFGGHVNVDPAERDFEKVKTRLLSAGAMTKRILLIDNVKIDRFSNGAIEAFITSPTISGHVLFIGEGTRPNNIVVAITANGARLSTDLAQRAVIVKLNKPIYDPDWEPNLKEFIEQNRWKIIGDMIEVLKQQPREMTENSRWSTWEQQVLCKASEEPNDALKTILERREEVDDDKESTAIVRNYIRQQLMMRRHDPDREAVFIPTDTIVEMVNDATNLNQAVNKACSFLLSLSIPEIKKSAQTGIRGYCWRGANCPPRNSMFQLNPAQTQCR